MTQKSYTYKPLNIGRLIVWGGFALVLLVAPMIFNSDLGLTMLSLMGATIIICLAYNMLMGQGGMLSFGYAIYSGFGAFCTIHILNKIGAGLPMPVSLVPIVGGLAGMAMSIVFGWVSTKKAGATFAMITLGVGELVYAASLMFPDFFGGESGVSSNRMVGQPFLGLTDGEGKRLLNITFGPQVQMYYLIAVYCFICTWVMFVITRTPFGRILNAVRDNPERVEFVGYNTQLVRYIAFVLSGFFAGIGGGLLAVNAELVQAAQLGPHVSGYILMFTYLGGGLFFFGPIIGGVLLVVGTSVLSKLTKAWLLYFGMLFVLVVMYAPGGVSSIILMNLRVAMFKKFKRLLLPYLGLIVTGVVLFLGLSTTIEMIYHRKFNALMNPEMIMWGQTLNVNEGSHWVAPVLVLLVGAALMEIARRYFKRHWDKIQEEIQDIIRMKEGA
jgi:branched-chain amino acid transport system permease protein